MKASYTSCKDTYSQKPILYSFYPIKTEMCGNCLTKLVLLQYAICNVSKGWVVKGLGFASLCCQMIISSVYSTPSYLIGYIDQCSFMQWAHLLLYLFSLRITNQANTRAVLCSVLWSIQRHFDLSTKGTPIVLKPFLSVKSFKIPNWLSFCMSKIN